MKMNEKTLCFLEEHIPELAKAALKQAYWRALASGHSVVQAEVLPEGGEALVEIHSDGTKTFIKSLPPSISVLKDHRVKIR